MAVEDGQAQTRAGTGEEYSGPHMTGGCADVIRSKDVVHMSWWGSPCYMSSCASPDSCGSRQLVAWDVERVAAGGCRRVRTWTRLCRRTCSSSSSSPSPATLTGPPGRHNTHHTLHGEPIKRESCGGGAITDFVAAVALGAELLDDRMSASPTCMRPYHGHGAWCPVQCSLCIAGERAGHLLRSVGSNNTALGTAR